MDKKICQLCGKENHCAIANGEFPANCWCMSKTIPASLLKNISPDLGCICEQCVNAAIKENR
jgi:hypothetical protein